MIVRPDRFWIGESRWEHELAVVDLLAGEAWPDEFVLPPCPVIGLGPRDAPGAAFVDAIIEPPATLVGVMAQIGVNPLAAAAIVQLLRLAPYLEPQEALVAESQAYAMLQGSAKHRAWLAANTTSAQGAPGRVHSTRDGAVLELVLDRQEQGNAIDVTMRDTLYQAFQLVALDPTIAHVVLRGAGKAFSLGADLTEFGTTSDPAAAHAIRAATLPAHMALRVTDRMEARVQGACVGSGLELAAFSGRVVAQKSAWFQLPELSMGILPGAGGCVSVTRRIGRQRAALMILSGKRVSAKAALDWGLVDEIVDDFA